MESYFTQTDPRWANIRFPFSKSTIKDIGCLITCIANILYKRCELWTPDNVLKLLITNNGLTKDNLVVWEAVYKIFKLKHLKYTKEILKKIDKETLECDHYIIEINCGSYNHFCNIIDFQDDKIKYFDVYDGKEKEIGFDSNKLVSIRRLESL